MKLKEIKELPLNIVEERIGKPPYLYCESGNIHVAQSLEYITMTYENTDISPDSIDVFAYGYKKDENDRLEYINPIVLANRFNKYSSEDVYECIEENGEISYMGFDELTYFYEAGKEMVVNGKPLKQFMMEEREKRKAINDELGFRL